MWVSIILNLRSYRCFNWCCMGLLPDTLKCGLRMRRECRERFPRHRLQTRPLVNDPGMHHGTCVTNVPWCMSRLLTRSGGETVPDIPGACATLKYSNRNIGRNMSQHCDCWWFGIIRISASRIILSVMKPIPDSKFYGAHLGPTEPRWAPCWPHEPCYLGLFWKETVRVFIHLSIISTYFFFIYLWMINRENHLNSFLAIAVLGYLIAHPFSRDYPFYRK